MIYAVGIQVGTGGELKSCQLPPLPPLPHVNVVEEDCRQLLDFGLLENLNLIVAVCAVVVELT